MNESARALPEILDGAAWLIRRRGHRLAPICLAASFPPLFAALLAARELAVTGGAMTDTFERLAIAAAALLVLRIFGLALVVELALRFLRRDRDSIRRAIARVARGAPTILFAGALASFLPILAGFAPLLGAPLFILAGPLFPLAVRRPGLGFSLPFEALRIWARAAGLQLALAAASAILGALSLLNAFLGVEIASLLAEALFDLDLTPLRPFLSLERPLARVAFGAIGIAVADIAWLLLQTVLLVRLQGARTGEDLAAELEAIREDLGAEAS